MIFIGPQNYSGAGTSSQSGTSNLANNKIAIFGDSITAQCSSATSGFENYGYLSWALQLSRQTFKFSHTYNFGVGGNTTTQMLARVGDVTASDASVVIVLGGTNDRGSANLTAAQTISNLTAIRNAILSSGKSVILVTPLPRGDSSNTGNRLSSTQLANHLEVRRWIISENQFIANVYPVDVWPLVADPFSSNGDILLGYTHDGLHPNTKGAFFTGKAISEVLKKLLPEQPILPSSNTDQYSADFPYGSVVVNPMFDGTTGTPATGGTGQLATGWSGTNATGTTGVTRTYSKVTSGGKVWQQVVIGGTAATQEAAIDLARQISLHTKAPAGTILEGVIEYEVDAGVANVMSLQLGIAVTSSGTTTLWDGDRYTGNSVLPETAFSGILKTPRIVVPEGTTDIRLRLSSYLVNGGAPSATIRVRAASLRKVDSL